MTDYVKITDYAAKDALLTGNPAKLVKGTEIGADFDAVATAVATKADSADPAFTGVVSFPDGSAAAPSITNTGDTNTGVFFPAADTVAVGTGGSERMRIDTNGNVGIGTTAGFTDISKGIEIQNADAAAGLRIERTGTGASAAELFTGLGTANLYTIGSYDLLFGTNNSERMRIDASGNVLAGADNTQTMGGASNRWSVVYAGTGTINTSDAREKTAVSALTASELNASKQLAKEIGTYKFMLSIEEKGNSARTHIGMTVQRAIEIMEENNLNPFAYGFICHDIWEEKTTTDEDGNTVVIQTSGDRYAFRPDELLMFIARGFDARLEALENVGT